MAILLNNHGYDNASWQVALAELLPEQQIYLFAEMTPARRQQIEYALVWDHPPGDLAEYPNLKGIHLLGAGTEAVDADSTIPDVPVMRLVDPQVLEDMARYALYWVLHFHRRFGDYAEQQERAHWERHNLCASEEFSVLVLGLGMVGKTVAKRLSENGYNVLGWDRNLTELSGVECYSRNELSPALFQADIVINCLPLTTATRYMIDAELLAQLPKGAVLVNISRGELLVEADVVEALETGHLSQVVLDAFSIEPLPADSPLWRHPDIHITPHMSGATYAHSAAKLVVDNIQRIEQGERPFPLHSPNRFTNKNNT
ncbi:2-hydroxyacid dehydrogenase [Aliamphritea ceti]|uniref:2-hydroxyacid dehydrogenase n=1 Tax=Aliamphritea ceti TaxID=1524258 RepID=UPI0021C392A1|nr:glyoxylate/hydroxypyruvate reductase A [Aliamphritea ceti]